MDSLHNLSLPVVYNLADLHRSRGFYYLATPYSKYEGGIERAFEDTCRVAGALTAVGVCVYSPIAHAHPVATHGLLDHFDHNLWLPLDERMMDSAVACLVADMPGWRDSYGVSHEIAYFRKHGKPVLQIPFDAKTIPSLLVAESAA